MNKHRTASYLNARPWKPERLTTAAPSDLDLAYDAATDAERRRHEARVMAAIRARAASTPATPENNPHLGVVASTDVPATLVRAYGLLDRYAATPGPVDQQVIDCWAHELTELVAQLRGAKSDAYEGGDMETKSRRAFRALRWRSTPQADRDRARWLLRVLSAAGHDPDKG